MLSIDTTTTHTVNEILDLALSFFGLDGMGLTLNDRTAHCVTFTGADGYVCVCAGGPDPDATTVNVEAMNLAKPARVFVQTL